MSTHEIAASMAHFRRVHVTGAERQSLWPQIIADVSSQEAARAAALHAAAERQGMVARGDLDVQAVTRLLYGRMPDPDWAPREFGPRLAGRRWFT